MVELQSRTNPLTEIEIENFFKIHFPYRLKILSAVAEYPRKVSEDPFWPSIYESAQITCRMFIQFFGLTADYNTPHLLKSKTTYFSSHQGTSTEVKIIDFGRDFIEAHSLSPEKHSFLRHAYDAGSKSTAHLNWDEKEFAEPSKVIKAACEIRKIMFDKFPELNCS